MYAVKPFFKQSVHLIRLEDFEQQLATAVEINFYKPKHLDSFICNHKRYTLNKHVKAKVGDYILVINPKPDSLDHHHLNAIEMVSSIEKYGVISNKSNGIKHTEYWVMVPGLEDGAAIIDFEQGVVPSTDPEQEDTAQEQAGLLPEINTPNLGDVYQRNDCKTISQAMVIGIRGRTVYLGGGYEVSLDELANSDMWSCIIDYPSH